jgi:glycosyltransferase involved in cell wall biosynthesis
VKILFLIRLFNPHIGGVEKHLSGLISKLQTHKIIVITEQYDINLPKVETTSNVTVYRIPVAQTSEGSKKWKIWQWISKHDELINSSDIIHVHDVFYWLYFFKLFHPDKKIYVTFHGWEGIFPIPIKNIVHKRLANLLSSGTIAVGDYISKWYGIHPNQVTYGAVDRVSSSRSITNKYPKLLFIGRLEDDTGFQECLERYKRLKDKLNWKLEIIGDGYLKNLIPNDASYLGIINNPYPYIANADFVYTTGYMGILEAFAHSKIVLTYFDNPVKRDYLLLHPMNKYFVFDDKIPLKLNPKAVKWAKNQTWDKLKEMYLKLWNQ